jgi:ABC-type multidrug transport system ATPase subunit
MKIDVEHVSKSYGAVRALDDISLEITPGQIVALLGPNGAGKTTLLRCLAGVAGRDKGEIRFDGERFARARTDMRRRLALLPDTPFYYPDVSVLRHISMLVHVYQVETAGIEEKVIDLLKDFDILPLAESPIKLLSRGQIYKANLAGFLAVDPELWLIDEPFASGMDPQGLNAFKKHIRDAVERGKTVFYTTQILEIAERFADRLCIISQGRIHAFDRVEAISQGDGSRAPGLDALFQQLRETPA